MDAGDPDGGGIHQGDRSREKTFAFECINASSTKLLSRIGDFDKGSNPIDDSVLDRTYLDLTGVVNCLLYSRLSKMLRRNH